MATNNTSMSFISDVYATLDPILGFFSDYYYAVFIVVLIISFVVAKIATRLISSIVAQITRRTKIRWDDQVIALLSTPMFWTIFLFGFLTSLIPLKLSKTIDDLTVSISYYNINYYMEHFSCTFNCNLNKRNEP